MTDDHSGTKELTDFVCILACMLLVVAAFYPWMRPIRVHAANSGLPAEMNFTVNVPLCATAALSLFACLAGRRWAVIVPAIYAAKESVHVFQYWAQPNGPVEWGLRPAFLALAIGSLLGLSAAFLDLRGRIRAVL